MTIPLPPGWQPGALPLSYDRINDILLRNCLPGSPFQPTIRCHEICPSVVLTSWLKFPEISLFSLSDRIGSGALVTSYASSTRTRVGMERPVGVEPTYSAWKAET